MSTNERVFFRARSYQRGVRVARKAGCRHFLCLWHRRCGKDRNAATFAFEEMLLRVGVYFHVFPSLNQGRRDFWDNIIQERVNGVERSIRMIEACFPREFVKRLDDKEMQIELNNGSLYQLMGCDDDEAVARMRGPNPLGYTLSEYAHGSKMKDARDTLSPVIAENGGWEILAYTPNGFNQGHDIYTAALKNQFNYDNLLGWYVQKLTVEDTRRDAAGEDGTPVVTVEQIESFRRDGQRPEFIAQEYWCDFSGFQHGTIYGDLMLTADAEARITTVPYIVNLPVGVIFDVGKSDKMSMWFYQRYGGATRFIDYYEVVQKDMRHAVHVMREQKPYIYGRIVLPWDSRGDEAYLSEMGFRNVHTCQRTASLQTSIDAVRRAFPTFYFDSNKCAVGIEHLRRYAREWDDDDKVFSVTPKHDQHSHAADSLRTGVEGGFEPLVFESWQGREVKVESSFDPREPAGGISV